MHRKQLVFPATWWMCWKSKHNHIKDLGWISSCPPTYIPAPQVFLENKQMWQQGNRCTMTCSVSAAEPHQPLSPNHAKVNCKGQICKRPYTVQRQHLQKQTISTQWSFLSSPPALKLHGKQETPGSWWQLSCRSAQPALAQSKIVTGLS